MASILPPHPVEKKNQTKEFDEQSILPPHPNKKDGSSQEFKEQSTLPPTGGSTLPPSGSSYSKYLGKYKGSGMLGDFEIKEKNGKLIADSGSGDVELTFVSGNKFKGKVLGFDAEIEFTVSNNVSTGGNLTVAGQTIPFTKTTSTPSKPDESGTEDKSAWSCIENYNKKFNQLSLIDRGDYRFEEVEIQHNGKDTVFMYYKDGRAAWALYSDKKPIMYGKWECSGKDGYLIKWSDGQISSYNTKLPGLTGSTTSTTTTENLCPNGYKEGCVSKADILGKKKALKACSKCDLVKEIQENPEIKARIFRLQKEAGQPEKTDNVFGPIMLAAIKEFQSSHGINPTGNVGELTLAKINPSQASQFYLDRGGKKFESGDKNGGAVDYLKAQRIKDDFDEADGVIYFMIGVGLKDKNAACSALIKSMERGEIESAEYYDARKCSEISGFPSYADFIKLYRTKLKSGKTPTTVQEPKVNDTVVNKGEVKSPNKPEVKPIYNRSSRQVLSPDEEL